MMYVVIFEIAVVAVIFVFVDAVVVVVEAVVEVEVFETVVADAQLDEAELKGDERSFNISEYKI